MPKAQRSVNIHRPQAEVFDYLADAENDPSWRPAVVSMRRVSGSGLGAVFEQRVPGPGGRPVPADIEVIEFDRPVVIGFRTIAGPVRPTGRYLLSLDGEDTRLEFSLEVEVGGFKRLFASMVQKTMDKEVAAIENLRTVLESPPAG